MFPISLNLAAVPILLVGEGEAFAKRKAQLEAAGAGKLIYRNAFNAYDLEDVTVVMVVGLDYDTSSYIARLAREDGKLVNVEDVPELCDFYFTSFVQRGELTISVSTGGASPTLAKRVREKIAVCFPEVWTERTAMIKALRDRLRGEGKSMREVMVETDKFIDGQAWIPACAGIKQ